MPIYEYECKACGHRHEALQKMSDDPLVECPECHEPALKKLISAAGFRLKGSGWYVTDFKHSGKKPADKSRTDASGKEGGSKTAESASDSGKTDSSKSDNAPKAAAKSE